MHQIKLFLRSLSLLFACTAAFGQDSPPRYTGMTPHEVRDGEAEFMGHYEGTLKLVIGLKPPHMQEEEEFLRQMQTPGHPQRFLTPEEWNARFAPSAADEQAVVDWAEASGFTVTKRFPNRLLVDVDAPANAVEKTLFTTINRYRIDGKEYYSNDMDPTLPPALALTVQSVTGLNNIQRAASQSWIPQKETAPRRGPFPEGTMP